MSIIFKRLITLFPLFPLLFLTSCREEAPVEEAVRPVKTMLVKEASSSEHQIVFPGTLRALKRADLSFRVDGTVLLRDIYVGYRAEQGETLMRLDPREYEIALQKAKGHAESTQAQLNFAQRDFTRMQNIYAKDPGAISANLVDRKKETVNQLKADLTVANSDVDKAADDLSYTLLKAPFDGIIAAIYVEQYEQVRAKQMALRLLDAADREMEIHVPEKYIHDFWERGNRLRFEVKLDAFPDTVLHASIAEIGTEASSTTQTYPVTLSLHDVPLQLSLLAGMSGRAFLTQSVEYTQSTFNIPKSALFTQDGHTMYVWIVDPNTQTVHKQPVRIDESNKGDEVLVQEGLITGDRIVTAGTSFLIEGQKVR